MKKYYKIGNLKFILKGDDKILSYLHEELQPVEVTESFAPNVIFDFKEPPKQIPQGIFASPVICTENEFLFKGGGLSYHVHSDAETLVVTIHSLPLRMGRIAKYFPEIFKLRNWNYLLPSEVLAKNFMYGVFDYITQIKNIDIHQSYFHASSFVKNNRSVAIVAWGGVGKTTSMLKLVTEDGWKFLSDDLGIIDEDGYVYRSPKKMQIYAYNLEGQPLLKSMLLKKRSIGDKLNWIIKKKTRGIKGVRRRISAENLFGKENVAVKTKLTNTIFIERAAVNEFMVEDITVDNLSSRAATTVMSEMSPYHQLETALYTALEKTVIPDYNLLQSRTKNILQRAFSNSECKLVKIPLHASPDDLAHFLKTII